MNSPLVAPYEYVDEKAIVADLKCSICLSPHVQPSITDCGHTFCQSCITPMVQSGPKPCPQCREAVSKETLSLLKRPRDSAFLNMLDALQVHHDISGHGGTTYSTVIPLSQVYCIERGECKWVGPRSNRGDHTSSCQVVINRRKALVEQENKLASVIEAILTARPVVINVGGTTFTIDQKHIMKFPSSLLAILLTKHGSQLPKTSEGLPMIFLDRDPEVAVVYPYIMKMLRLGRYIYHTDRDRSPSPLG